MHTLNDLPYEPEEAGEWTPFGGLVRGAVWGLVTSLILAAMLAPAAWYAPLMVSHFLLRAVIGFGTAWILFSVIQQKAGMAGWPTTGMALACTLLVLFSHHAIFAVHGVPTRTGVVAGLIWLHPLVIWTQDLAAIAAAAICAAMRHSGDGGADGLVEILMRPMYLWPW